MDSAPYDLTAACWTSAGDVRPGITSDVSPIPIERRIAAVAEAGFSGIGIELADLREAQQTLGWPRLRSRIESAGLVRVEVEFLDDWWIDGPRRESSDARRRGLLAAAEALGADHLKVGGGKPGDPVERGRLLNELGRLADEASAHGTRIALEPGAGSALGELGAATSLLTELAHPAAGLMLDIWHVYRSGIPYGELADLVPSHVLIAVELDDGAAAPVGPLFDDTFDNRLLCGDGAFDVPAFVEAVRAIGFHGPWGVEVMSTRLRDQSVETTLAEARDTALVCLRAPA